MAQKEHKQGEVITLDNGVKLQVIAHGGCDKCYFTNIIQYRVMAIIAAV